MNKLHYAYRVTGSDGSMADRIQPGEVVFERMYLGQWHDWHVYNRKSGEVTGGFTGCFIGRVELDGNQVKEQNARKSGLWQQEAGERRTKHP